MAILTEELRRQNDNWDGELQPGDYLRARNMLFRNGALRPRPGISPAAWTDDTTPIVLATPFYHPFTGFDDNNNTLVGLGSGTTEDGFGVLVLLVVGLVSSTPTLYATTFTFADDGTYVTYHHNVATTDLTSYYDGTVSTSVMVFASAALNDKIVFTDGIGTPIMYDCTAGTWTKLTDAPKARSVTTYYQKIVFGNIQETDKSNRIEWSEEGDPETGYDGGIYDNFWVFGQQDTGPVMAVEGTNEALYVFKRTSISAVRGPTEDAFTTDGTREGVSTNVGALGPYCTTIAQNGVLYFMSQERDIYAIPPGGMLSDVTRQPDGGSLIQGWKDRMEAEYGGWSGSYTNICVAYDPANRLVMVLPTRDDVQTYPGLLLDVETGSICDFHFDDDVKVRGIPTTVRGEFNTGFYDLNTQFPTFIGFTTTAATFGTSGGTLGFAFPLDDTVATDFYGTSFTTATDISCVLWSRKLGAEEPGTRKLFTGVAVDVELRDRDTATELSIRKYADQGDAPTMLSGTAQTVTIGNANEKGMERVRWGFREYGVDMMVEISFETGDIAAISPRFGAGVEVVDAFTEYSF